MFLVLPTLDHERSGHHKILVHLDTRIVGNAPLF